MLQLNSEPEHDTETTIIVDARGTQSYASELTQQVCLLVRERTTTKDANGVPAIAHLCWICEQAEMKLKKRGDTVLVK